MEKLIYVLWRRETDAASDFKEELLGATARRIAELGGERLKVLVADEHTEPLEKAAIRRSDPPIAGAVSFWLDCVDLRGRIESYLGRVTGRHVGFLVTESVPIPNATRRVPLGERTPGTTMLTFIERPERLSWDQWLGFWNEFHTPMAGEVQSTYLYVRHVVVRRLALDTPPWAGIVEEGFPTEAVTDPMLWYDAGGSKERLHENLGRMMASVRTFLDVDRVESLPMSEYVLG